MREQATEQLTDPTSQIRYLKITAAVEIKVEDGKWIARSSSIGLQAEGETPEEAMKVLEQAISQGEREASSIAVKVYVPRAEKERLKALEEEVKTSGLSFTVDDIMVAKKAKLIEMCTEVNVDSTGKNVTELQSALFDVLTAGDEKIGDAHTEE